MKDDSLRKLHPRGQLILLDCIDYHEQAGLLLATKPNIARSIQGEIIS